jgi:hypothetical protein
MIVVALLNCHTGQCETGKDICRASSFADRIILFWSIALANCRRTMLSWRWTRHGHRRRAAGYLELSTARVGPMASSWLAVKMPELLLKAKRSQTFRYTACRRRFKPRRSINGEAAPGYPSQFGIRGWGRIDEFADTRVGDECFVKGERRVLSPGEADMRGQCEKCEQVQSFASRYVACARNIWVLYFTSSLLFICSF